MGGVRGLWSAVAAAAAVSAAPFEGCVTVEVDGSIRRASQFSQAVCASGATFPNSLYQLSALSYSEYGVVRYTPTGSASGKESIANTVVDYAGTDSLLSESDYAEAPDLQMYPAAAAAARERGVVPFVNLAEVAAIGEHVVVDRATLPLIYLGDIYEWTDSRLLALQGNATRVALLGMADPTIHVIVRDEGSGISDIFTKALSSFSADFAARIGSGDILDWCEDGDAGLCLGANGECEGLSWVFDSGFDTSGTVTCNKTQHHAGRTWQYTRGSQTAGVIAAVRSLPGSIGYAPLADVNTALIPQALVANRAGQPIEASTDTVSYALFEFAGLIDERGNAELFDAYSTYAYPIVGFTYFVLRKGVDGDDHVHMSNLTASMFDCSTRLRTLSYLEWFYTSSSISDLASNLGFTTLPRFIASSIIDKMLDENYCREDDGGEVRVRRVKERDVVASRPLVADFAAAQPSGMSALVYHETEPTVQWEVSTSPFATQQLAAFKASIADGAGEDELGIISLDRLDAGELPFNAFVAPLFLIGIAPVYHLMGVDNLVLSLEQMVSVLLGEVTTWSALRADLAASTIQLIVRTDDCDANEIVTARLSAVSPIFNATIGVTRAMSVSALADLGVNVIAVASRLELESAIAFFSSTMAFAWERMPGFAPAKIAALNVSSSVLTVAAPSLEACMSAEAAVSLKSAKYHVESRFYDVSRSTTTGCWPFARTYNLLISEELIGPDPCSSLASAFFADFETSHALAFSQWFFTSAIAFSFRNANLGSALAADRAAAAARLHVTAVCIPPKPNEEKQLISSGLKAFLGLLVAVNYIFAIVCIAWTFRYRRRVILRLSQPTYLYFLCLGSIVTVTSSLSPLFGPTDLACQLMVWLYGMGFATTQATLFTKMQQMTNVIEYSLQMKSKARSIKVHRREIGQAIGAMFGGELVLLLAWYVVAPLGYKRSCIEHQEDGYWDGVCIESVGKCRTTQGVTFVAALASYHVLCILSGMWMCYKSRNLPSIMAEGKWVFTAYYSQLQVFITAVPVLAMVKDDVASFTILKSLVTCVGDLTTMVMIYVPKMALVYQYYDFSRQAVSALVSTSMANSTQKNLVYESLRVKRVGTAEDHPVGLTSTASSMPQSTYSSSVQTIGARASPAPSTRNPSSPASSTRNPSSPTVSSRNA